MLISVLFAAMVPAEPPEPDLFTTKVRPVLAAHCFKCHGPDDKARKAKLRLDVRENALRVLAPGKAGESELVRRITSHDDSVTMPPPSAKIPLTEAEKQLLAKWIESGAKYTPHWAFVAPHRPSVPTFANTSAAPQTGTLSPKSQVEPVRNPIDSFVRFRFT